MKLTAIGRGGSKKDFFDLYFILLENKISIKTLVELYIKKYGINSMNCIIMGLTYFEDAENEVLPQTFVSFDFKKIKKYFVNVSKEIINETNKIS